jgi:hypothetical protein
MGTDQSGFADAWRRANDVFLAPLVAFPSLGLAAVNATVGTAARLAERAAQATGGAFGTPGRFAEDLSRRVADRTLDAARESADIAFQAIGNATGRPAGRSSNELLSTTVLDKSTATAALPLFIAWDTAVAAIQDVPVVKDAASGLWRGLSRFLDAWSSHGVLTGRARHETDSVIRFGFNYMAVEGPLQAVARDFRGIVGGVLALGMGDFNWLAKAAKDYWASMEYVYDKWLAGETQPETDFPISALLARVGKTIIQRFPRPFIAALESRDPLLVGRAAVEDAGELFTMLGLYPASAFLVIFDVMVFVLYAWLEPSDTIDYALSELAIVESDLTDEEKTMAMERLRKTAGHATVEFQYYVPLLVPAGGTAADQAHSTSATGQVINEYTIAESVFQDDAIERAQAINSELIQLRAFLWLYRDEAMARRKSYQETVRKFGQKVADRIEKDYREGRSLYPLTAEEIAALMEPEGRSGAIPRPAEEVNEIFYEVLRRRGLLYVSDLVSGKPTAGSQSTETLYGEYPPEVAGIVD